MSGGSFLSALVGKVVGELAPHTGPATGDALTTVSSGNLQGLGHDVDAITNASGYDTTNSTILHGVAQTVVALSSTGISNVLEPVASTLLAPVTSPAGSAIGTPVTLLAPHTGPAAGTLLTAVGSGDVAAIGNAVHGAVNTAGADIAQSTILHGAAGVLTSLASADNFHFAPSTAGGSDALSGVLNNVSALGGHAAAPSSGMAAGVAHVEAPVDVPHPLAELAHAVHHA